MLIQSGKMALKAISGNKMRSFLTMLGVIIGVIALVVLVSLVSSASTSITDQVSSLGSDLISVNILDDKENPIKLSELSVFAEDDEIELISPETQTMVHAKAGSKDETANIYGVLPSYFSIQDLQLESGRFIKTADSENGSYVGIISQKGADKLYGRTNIVGENLSLNGRNITIIGVLKEDESIAAMFGGNVQIYMPYTVVASMMGTGNNVTTFYASATNTESLDFAEERLNAMMLNRFKNDKDAFSIFNQSSLMDTMNIITGILTMLLGGIAAISLLVGGIGIMNIMLVSVTERTREIGIRKAIGAGRGSIMLQFIIEALILSLMGCFVGIILSWLIIELMSNISIQFVEFSMSLDVVWIAVSFSVAIGLIFGIYPANKASKKNPIEALRHDG